MSTITRERAELKSFITGFLSDPAHDNQSSRSMTAEVFRIALASLEAEPVAWIIEGGKGDTPCHVSTRKEYAEAYPDRKVTPLYTAQPAPVSVPECFQRLLHHAYGMTMGHDWNKGTMAGHHRDKLCQAVDECRAAMLQGAENAESRCTIQTAPALDSSPKIAEPRCGNSPVIPDGWVACSERMPETDGNYWGWWSESKRQGPAWFIKSELQAQFQSSEITHWMPMPAAPRQEVK